MNHPPDAAPAPGWHHCGRCGFFYQEIPGRGASRACPSCKHNPVPDYETWRRKQNLLRVKAMPAPGESPAPQTGEAAPAEKANRSIVVKFVAGWVFCLILLVGTAKFYLFREDDTPKPQMEKFHEAGENADNKLVQDSYNDCLAALSGFFDSATPESRSQFVIDPFDAVKHMSANDTVSPLASVDGLLQNTMVEVIRTARGPAIETSWKTKSGADIDAVFFKEGDGWKIDWRELIRHSDQAWSVFLAGTGKAEGEFRLLARERLEGDHQLHTQMGVVFYAPRFGHMTEGGSPSPEFSVDTTSPEGRLLIAAFNAKKEGRGPFGSHLLSSDPKDFIRVRVIVRRDPGERLHKFKLVKVSACHWFSLDEPGYDPAPLPGS